MTFTSDWYLKSKKWIKIILIMFLLIPINFNSQEVNFIALAQELKLTIKEISTESIKEAVPIFVQDQRNISLVPGLSYEVNCNHKRGFGGVQNVWFYPNSTPIANQEKESEQSNNLTSVYSVRSTNNDWKLVLNHFNTTSSEGYTCRGSSVHVSLTIASGNPILLSSNPELRLRLGKILSDRPLLLAFISGSPQPADSDITWYFNDNEQLPSGTLIIGNELLLPRNIRQEVAGIYKCQVNTSAGTEYDYFKVIVTAPPSLHHILGTQGIKSIIARNGSSQVTLTANVMGGMPPVSAEQISWKRMEYDVPIDVNSAKYNLTYNVDPLTKIYFTIKSPTFEDSDLYTLIITHEACSACTLEFQLQVLDAPSPPVMLTVTSLGGCNMVLVNWTLADPSPTNTALPAYVIIQVKTDSTEWFEFGRSNITYDSKMGALEGSVEINMSSPVMIIGLHVRARCGNDTGNIGLGEYYEKNSTYFIHNKAPNPPLGLRWEKSVEQTSSFTLQWIAPSMQSECGISAYLVICECTLANAMDIKIEVPGNTTSTVVSILAQKDETCNCSVQARNDYLLLSNRSNIESVHINISQQGSGNDTDVTESSTDIVVVITGIILIVIIGPVLVLLLLIIVFFILHKVQNKRSSKLQPIVHFSCDTLSVAMSKSEIEESLEDDDKHTPNLEDVCTYSYEFTSSSVDGLPTGGWDSLDLKEI